MTKKPTIIPCEQVLYNKFGKVGLGCNKSIQSDLSPTPIFFYLFTIAFPASLVITTGLLWVGRKSKSDGQKKIRSREYKRELGVDSLREKAKQIRPGVEKFSPSEVGFEIGRLSRRRPVWVSWEDSIFVEGPARSGKTTSVVLPLISRVPGAAVVTSTRDELIKLTAKKRSEVGNVYVFSPYKDDFFRTNPHLKRFTWDPIKGCEDIKVAERRARSLVEAGSGLTSGAENQFWLNASIQILRSYFYAAALGGKSIKDVASWANNFLSPVPSNILEEHNAQSLADELRQKSLDTKLAVNMWSPVLNALNVLSNTEIANQLSLTRGVNFRDFLTGKSTLYLASSGADQANIAPLVALYT